MRTAKQCVGRLARSARWTCPGVTTCTACAEWATRGVKRERRESERWFARRSCCTRGLLGGAGAGLFVLAVGFCSNPHRIATQKGAGGIDVPCFLDGGRLTYEYSLVISGTERSARSTPVASHPEMQVRFRCRASGTWSPQPSWQFWHLHGRCLETRRLHLRSPQPTASAQREWLLTNGQVDQRACTNALESRLVT